MLLSKKQSNKTIKQKFIHTDTENRIQAKKSADANAMVDPNTIEEHDRSDEPEIDLPEDSYMVETQELEETVRYSYLEDTPLNRMETEVNFQQSFIRAVCMYRWNENMEEPFLEFLFYQPETIYTFPFEKYEPGFFGGGDADAVVNENKKIGDVTDNAVALDDPESTEEKTPKEQPPISLSEEVEIPISENIDENPPTMENNIPFENYQNDILFKPIQESENPEMPKELNEKSTEMDNIAFLKKDQESIETENIDSLEEDQESENTEMPKELNEKSTEMDNIAFLKDPEEVNQESTEIENNIPFETPSNDVLSKPIQESENPEMPKETENILPSEQPGTQKPSSTSFLEYLFPAIFKKEYPPITEPTLEDSFLKLSSPYFSIPTEKWDESYKGFVHISHNNIPHYIGFIEVTDFEEIQRGEQEESPKLMWGITDEIIEKKHILGTTIDDVVYRLFLENPSLNFIQKHTSIEDTYVPPPHVLYLCQQDGNGNFDNVYYDKTDPFSHSISMFHTDLPHGIFGMTHLFTVEPFEEKEIENIKRYAVQIKDPHFLLNHEEDITEFPELLEKELEENNVYFYEQDIAFWSIKNANAFVEIL